MEKQNQKIHPMITYDEMYAEVVKAIEKEEILSPIRAINSLKSGKEIFVPINDVEHFSNLAAKMEVKCYAKWIDKDGVIFESIDKRKSNK